MVKTPALKKTMLAETRRLARLMAVQALYQADVMGQSAVLVLKEIETHRLLHTAGEAILHDADTGERMGAVDVMLMRDTVALALQHRDTLEGFLTAHLPKDWPLHRLEKPLLMILLAGAAELYQNAKTPAPIIISDYIDITKAFYDDSGKEPGLVNAILDRVGKKLT